MKIYIFVKKEHEKYHLQKVGHSVEALIHEMLYMRHSSKSYTALSHNFSSKLLPWEPSLAIRQDGHCLEKILPAVRVD